MPYPSTTIYPSGSTYPGSKVVLDDSNWGGILAAEPTWADVQERWTTWEEVRLPLNAIGRASTALKITAAPRVGTQGATGAASTALALCAQTFLALSTSGASAASLALRASAQLSLSTSGASADALALRGPAQVTGVSAGQSTGALALSAPTRVPLNPVAGFGGGLLALQAPTTVDLEAAGGKASTQLALTAPSLLGFGIGEGEANTALTLRAPASLALATAGASGGAVALSAATRISLAAASGSGAGNLALSAPTRVVLAAAIGVAADALALRAPTRLDLAAGAGQSSGALNLRAPTTLPLTGAAGVADGAVALTTPAWLFDDSWAALQRVKASWEAVEVTWATWAELLEWKPPLNADGAATTALALNAPAQLDLEAAGGSSTALTLRAPSLLALNSAGGSTGALALHARTLLALTSAGQAGTALAVTALTQIALNSATGTSASALALAAPTGIALAATAGGSASALALSAPTRVALAAVAGSSTTALALRARALLVLASAGTSASALTVSAPTAIDLELAAGEADGSLAIAPRTLLVGCTWEELRREKLTWAEVLATWETWAALLEWQAPLSADGRAETSLDLNAAVALSLGAAGSSSSSLSLKAPSLFALAAAGGSSGAMALRAATRIPLSSAAGASEGTLSLHAPALLIGRTWSELIREKATWLDVEEWWASWANRVQEPSFETALVAWTPAGGNATFNIFERSEAWAADGKWSLHFKATATANGAIPRAFYDNSSGLSKLPVKPGERFRASVILNVVTLPKEGKGRPRLTIRFRNAAKTELISDANTAPVVATGVSELSEEITVPAGAAWVDIEIGSASAFTGMDSGEIVEFYLDSMVLAPKITWADLLTWRPPLSADGVSTTSLELQAAPRLPLASAGGGSAASLALAAPMPVVLGASAGAGGGALALRATALLDLGVAAGSAAILIRFSTTTQITEYPSWATLLERAEQWEEALPIWPKWEDLLQPVLWADGKARSSLALHAPTLLTLGSASGGASTALALTAHPVLQLAPSPGGSATTLKLRATTLIELAASGGSSSTSALFATRALITEAPTWGTALARAESWEEAEDRWSTWEALLRSAIWSDGKGRASLFLTAPSILNLSTAGGSSTALALTASTRLTLAGAAGSSTTSLALHARALLALATSGASATALSLHAASVLQIAAAGVATTNVLALTVRTFIEGKLWEALERRKATWEEAGEEWLTWQELLDDAWPIYSDGSAAGTLALTAPTELKLNPSSGVATTALSLHAPTRIILGAAAGISAASATIRTIAPISGTSAGVASSGPLSLTVRAFIENLSWAALSRRQPTWEATEATRATWAALLEPPWPLYSDGVSSTVLALHAPTEVPLKPAAGVASTSLALHAPTCLILAGAAGSSTASFTVRTIAPISGASQGTSTGGLALTVRTFIENCSWAALMRRKPNWESVEEEWLTWGELLLPPWPLYADGLATTSLALHAPTEVILAAGKGVSTTALALHAPTCLILAGAAGSSTASFTVRTIAPISGASQGTSTGGLALTVRTFIENCSWAALMRRKPNWESVEEEWLTWGELLLPPWPLYADGLATTSLALHAPTEVILAAGKGVSTTALALHVPSRVVLNRGEGTSTTSAIFRTTAPITAGAVGTSTSTMSMSVRTLIEGKTWEGLWRRIADWSGVQAEWATWAKLLEEHFPIFSDGRSSATLRLHSPSLLELRSTGTATGTIKLTARPHLELVASHGIATTRLAFPGYKVRQEGVWRVAIHRPPMKVRAKGTWLPV